LLPDDGDVFLVPLRKKLMSFLWVVGFAGQGNAAQGSFIIVAAAKWVGNSPPTAAEIERREVLVANYEDRADDPLVRMVCEAPPRAFRWLAKVDDPKRGVPKATKYASYVDTFKYVMLEQWRWDHEREKLLADNAATLEAEERTRAMEDARDAERLARRRTATLAELGRMRGLLFEWEGLRTERQQREVEAMLRASARSLAKLRGGTRERKLALIEKLTNELNAWNDRRNFMDTPEREGLAAAIDDIGHAAGLRGHDLAGPWRDW
jgi:hypothetical protein